MKSIFAVVLFVTKLHAQFTIQQTVLPEPVVTVSKDAENLIFSVDGIDGRKVATFPRGDTIKADLQSSWRKNADGTYTYDMAIDMTDVWIVRLGDESTDKQQERPVVRETSKHPAGLLRFGPEGYIPDFHANAGKARKNVSREHRVKDASFSLNSNRLPGLVAVSLISEETAHAGLEFPDDISARDRYALQAVMLEHIGFENNSLRHYIIGPAISPDASRDDLLDLVRVWVNHYGFEFLAPVLDAGRSLEDGLNAVKPVTDLDREIVACLWSAL